MRQSILLDTCAVIFLASNNLSASALAELERADRDNIDVFVSPITAWEISVLVSRGRLMLTKSVDSWFAAIIASGIMLTEMNVETLVASSFLPGSTLRDPADRILAATARVYGYRLMTRDRPLLEYAEMGHLSAISC